MLRAHAEAAGIDPVEPEALLERVGRPRRWELTVSTPAQARTPDSLSLGLRDTVSADFVRQEVARCGCDERLAQRALSLLPPSRCSLGVGWTWGRSSGPGLSLRFGGLQSHFESVQCARRVLAVATLCGVALDLRTEDPGGSTAVMLSWVDRRWRLGVEAVAPAVADAKGVPLRAAWSVCRSFEPTAGPLVGYVDDNLPASITSAAVHRARWSPDAQTGRIGTDLAYTASGKRVAEATVWVFRS